MACDILGDFQWARVHSAPKRLRVIASMVMAAAGEQQRMAQKVGDRSKAPLFTEDVGMTLVDAQLTAAGSEHGCTREEVQSVFDWLTNALVGPALLVDGSRSYIVAT